ncbi:MAG TPA: hypothetical protein VHO91_02995, partial [Rhodopila sp.]|nr:hypothetical protein [Rhodopila sp.]
EVKTRIRCCAPPSVGGPCGSSPPDLIKALEFRAARTDDPVLAALRLLADLNRSGRREVPPYGWSIE